MRTTIRAAVAAVAVTTALAAALLSEAGPAVASGVKASVAPCTINDVSFYYGGYTQGLSQVSLSLTLLAHDGVTCTLSDTPLISLSGPANQQPIPLEVNGRGGTLTLDSQLPLHTTILYAVPDSATSFEVDYLTLSMPDKTSRTVYFAAPDGAVVSSDGVSATSWNTGIGLGLGEEPLGY